MYNFILTLLLSLCLCSCAHEASYRGVPGPTWQQLSGEQKQLIVDQSFEEEIASA